MRNHLRNRVSNCDVSALAFFIDSTCSDAGRVVVACRRDRAGRRNDDVAASRMIRRAYAGTVVFSRRRHAGIAGNRDVAAVPVRAGGADARRTVNRGDGGDVRVAGDGDVAAISAIPRCADTDTALGGNRAAFDDDVAAGEDVIGIVRISESTYRRASEFRRGRIGIKRPGTRDRQGAVSRHVDCIARTIPPDRSHDDVLRIGREYDRRVAEAVQDRDIAGGVGDTYAVERDCRTSGNLEVEVGRRPRQHTAVLHDGAICERGYVNRLATALRRRVELSRVGGRTGHGHDGRRPARKRVGIFGGFGLGWRRPAVDRRGAVLDGRCGNSTRAVDVRPRNRVAALRRVECRRVGGRAGYGRHDGRPPRECVGVFSSLRLRRRCATVNGRVELIELRLVKDGLAILVKPRHGVFGDERAETRIPPFRELPDIRVPSLERDAARHLRSRETRHADAVGCRLSARLRIPVAAVVCAVVVARRETADVAAARHRHSANRIAVGQNRYRPVSARLRAGDEAAAEFTARVDIAQRVAVFDGEPFAEVEEAAGNGTGRCHVARRKTPPNRRVVRIADESARVDVRIHVRRGGAVLNERAAPVDEPGESADKPVATHGSADNADVPERGIAQRAEEPNPFSVVVYREVADFIAASVVFAAESVRAQTREVRHARHVDVRRLHVVARVADCHQILCRGDSLAEHRRDPHVVEVVSFRNLPFPAHEHAALIRRRHQFAVNIRDHPAAVRIREESNNAALRQAVDYRRFADNGCIAVAIADELPVVEAVIDHLRPVVAVRNRQGASVLEADQAAGIAVIAAAIRLVSGDKDAFGVAILDAQVVAVRDADQSAALARPRRHIRETTAAANCHVAAVCMADEAADGISVSEDHEIHRAVLYQSVAKDFAGDAACVVIPLDSAAIKSEVADCRAVELGEKTYVGVTAFRDADVLDSASVAIENTTELAERLTLHVLEVDVCHQHVVGRKVIRDGVEALNVANLHISSKLLLRLLRRRVERRRVGRVALDRRNSGRPSRKRVGVFSGFGLYRRRAVISRHDARNDSVFFQQCVVPVPPLDSVLGNSRVVGYRAVVNPDVRPIQERVL